MIQSKKKKNCLLIIYHVPGIVDVCGHSARDSFFHGAFILVPWGRQKRITYVIQANLLLPHFILLYLQILPFLQIGCLWHPCTKQVYQDHSSNSICSLPISVSYFDNSHNISHFLRLKKDYYICCSDLCSAIFEVIIKMEGGQTAPRWEDELNKCVCSDCSTDWQLPSSLPLLQPLYSLRHNTGIRPINNLMEASKYSNERRSPTSLTWNQKLEIIKLTEEGKSKA